MFYIDPKLKVPGNEIYSTNLEFNINFKEVK